MSTTETPTRVLAARLIAIETARPDALPTGGSGAAVRVADKLGVRLAKLAGVAGYRSLMSRALALSKAEVPSLGSVQVRPDGTLEGFDAAGQAHDAGAVMIAHLLGLLVTFIGEPLTLGLLRDAWPDADTTELDAGKEGEV